MSGNVSVKHKFDLEDRTLTFSKAVIRLCQSLRLNPVNHELISQLVRSSGSVGANYREANDALSKKDFRHRIKIARKEAKEALYWLKLVLEANADKSEEVEPLMQEALELKKILSAIVDKCE